MHEKVKLFLQKYWIPLVISISFVCAIVLGFRHLRAGLDIDVKHNKITITKTK